MAVSVSSSNFAKMTADAKIVLKSDKSVFNVHKALLAASSMFFNHLFTFNESSEYSLQDVTKEAFEVILAWIYKHECKLTTKNVAQVFIEANYLDCREVAQRCKDFLLGQLCEENALGFLSYAQTYFLSELRVPCQKYVNARFLDVQKSGEFLELSADELGQLLQGDDLNASEENIWGSVMRWIRHEPPARSVHLPRIVSCVRTGLFKEEFLYEQVLVDLGRIGDLEEEERTTMMAETERYYVMLKNVASIPNPIVTPAFAMPRLSQDVVLTIGGWSNGVGAINLIESYDIRADRWHALPEQDPLGERGYMGVAAIGSKIYLVGGTNGVRHFNDTTSFDVVTKQFAELSPMHCRARVYVSLAAVGGCLYAVGGYDGFERLKTLERYCPETNQWTKLASMKSARSDADCAVLGDRIYVVGGFDGISQLDTIESYNTKTNKWRCVKRMSQQRSGVSCVAFEGELYVLGGCDGTGRLQSVEKYNPRTNLWTALPEMQTTRSNFTAAVVDKNIMVVGGFDGSSTTAKVECFDPKTNRWCSSSNMQVHRSALSLVVVNGKDLPKETTMEYKYPNRHLLAEEKRLFEIN